MNIDKEQFKKMFPHLAREMDNDKHTMEISSVRSDAQIGEKAVSKRFTHYVPDIIDFIRRCDNEQQAEEIIAYIERKREISKEYATRLRRQLKKEGVRSFGSKKEDGYYFIYGET